VTRDRSADSGSTWWWVALREQVTAAPLGNHPCLRPDIPSSPVTDPCGLVLLGKWHVIVSDKVLEAIRVSQALTYPLRHLYTAHMTLVMMLGTINTR